MKIPTGWRVLEPDDVIKRGDKFFFAAMGEWVPTICHGTGLTAKDCGVKYIRKIP